jgi:MFS family permease
MQRPNSTFMLWLMWGLASFFYAYQYIIRVLPNVMMLEILEKYHIDAAIFGQYSGLYYIGYAGMHIPVGILLDKYGPKWVLPFCMVLTVVGLLPLIYAEHWLYPSFGRILIGMGSSAAILGVFKIIRICFSEEKFPFMLGLSVMIGLLGAIYGGQPINYLIHQFGSDTVIKGIVGVGLLLAVCTAWVIPRHDLSENTKGWWESVKSVLSQPQIMAICIFAGFMVGPLEGFADVWGKEYLKSVYHLNEALAASLPSLIFLGMCFGSPTLSWLASRFKSYYGFIILSAIAMSGAFVLLLTASLSINVLTVLFILVGIFCAYQILAIYLASTFVKEDLVGLTTACANMIIMIFGYVFHSLIGKVMDINWTGESVNGIPVYSAETYTAALLVIPIGLMLGGAGYIGLKLISKRRTRSLL